MSNPEMELHMINMIYLALLMPCAHKQKRQHFYAKTTSAKLYIYNGVGAREAHIALDIFRFVAFSFDKLSLLGAKRTFSKQSS